MASRDHQASGKVLEPTRRAHAGPDSPSPEPFSAPAPNHHPLPILTRLLTGQTQELAPIRTNPIEYRDAALDVHQREAVARALATSDFCLIRGLPGTGKSRVVAELIIQASARAERVLLGALTSAAIDRVLEMVHAHEEVSAIRCLAPEEGIENLPPFSRALTFAERMNHWQATSRERARHTVATHREHMQRLRENESVWVQLQEWGEQLRHLENQLEDMTRQRLAIPDEVEQQAALSELSSTSSTTNSFLDDLNAAVRRFRDYQTGIDNARSVLEAKIALRKEETGHCQTQLEKLRPLMELQRTWHWWIPAWWTALFRKNLGTDFNSLQDQLRRTGDFLAELDQEIKSLKQKGDEAETNLHEELSRRKQQEIRKRQSDLDQRCANLDHDRKILQGKATAALNTVNPETPCSVSANPTDIQTGFSLWRRELGEREKHLEFLNTWIPCLEESAPGSQLFGKYCNLVAGTLSGLASDERFGLNVTENPDFDLLILQEADQITQADFLKIAPRTRRWVLVGDPSLEKGPSAQRAYPLRHSPASDLGPSFFERLWRQLHWEPRHMPYTWVQEKDRLCCRLRPVPSDQQQWIETECVADYPEIELRILALPRTEPVLAEVVFPTGFSIVDAKSYLFRELQELTINTLGHSILWIEEPNRLVLRLADDPIPHTHSVVLEPGVRELVGSWHPQLNGPGNTGHWHTCCLEFDRAAGWDRERAEEWVWRQLGIRDLGRTIRLDVPHRMHPDLASFVSHLLFAGEYRVGDNGVPGDVPASPNGPCAVEFVPVPPLRDPSRSIKKEMVASAKVLKSSLAGKGGAGLEIDLADPRQRSRLPSDLLVCLPNRGLVNYPEAQAVVRYLEALARDPARLSDVDGTGGREIPPRVAVISLYSSHALLIQKLVEKSAKLAAVPFDLLVDVPAAFRERECSWVLLSLTRSHSHRAVTFGDGPEMLALALTRGLSHLVLFGDPGTLARRSQWAGRLENLDEAAAARERELITQLVNYLQGNGAYPRAFQLREGVGP